MRPSTRAFGRGERNVSTLYSFSERWHALLTDV